MEPGIKKNKTGDTVVVFSCTPVFKEIDAFELKRNAIY